MRNPQNDFSASGLAPELFVRDLVASIRFYEEGLGFDVVRQDQEFAVLSLGAARIQLVLADESVASVKAWLDAGPRGVGVNIRIIVDDVDALYERARRRGVPIIREIDDRFYELRDFTVGDPDGFVLSFASPVSVARAQTPG
jgi:uncharacterized glyoxalase superfamily protein PhnB